MTHTIMLIPTSAKVNPAAAAQSLSTLLAKKNITATPIPELDSNSTEQFLANNNLDDLLTSLSKTTENLSQNNEVVLIAGLPLTKPYAAEVNFDIATSLDAAIIFVTSSDTKEENLLSLLKIISLPYLHRYKKTVLGFMVDQKNSLEKKLQNQLEGLTKENIPLIGSTTNFNFDLIKKFLETPQTRKVTPAIFKNQLINKAFKSNRRIILPEGDEPRTIAAANICSEQNIAKCVLLGNKAEILNSCKQLNLTPHPDIEIIEPENVSEKYVEPFFEMRKSKGLTIEKAKEQLKDNVVLGTIMLQLGEADGLVSGAIHTTANTIRPAFQLIKTAPNAKLVSSIFFMCLPDQVLVFGDCAINPNPSAEELADIAIQSAKSAKAFGINPKVAMLSYSTGKSGFGPSVDKIKNATNIAKSLQPDLIIEGPIQYDAAVSKETAKIKFPDSKVAGQATVFIMPNLDVGNIVYKAVQRNTGIICIGPMLQGLNKPVNDLSRGCSIDDIVFTIALTVVQAVE